MDKAKLGCVARSMQFDHGSTTAFLNLHFWHCAVSAQCMLLSTPVISKLGTTHRPDGMTARGGLGAGHSLFYSCDNRGKRGNVFNELNFEWHVVKHGHPAGF